MREGVWAEIQGQYVGPCVVLRRFGFLCRLMVPCQGNTYTLRWVPRWRCHGRSIRSIRSTTTPEGS